MSKAWPVAGIDPAETLAENARRILAVRTGEFFSYAAIVDQEDAVEQLHALRIAAKRLRYTLELFRDVYGTMGGRLIEHVKAMQEELGEVHDHDVRLDLIAAELASLDARDDGEAVPGAPDPRVGLAALSRRETGLRREHYQTFCAQWRRLGPEMRAELVALSSLRIPDLAA